MAVDECDNCGGLAEGGAIVNGIYQKLCHECLSGESRLTGNVSYARNKDMQDHGKDIIQPWMKGKPNKEFIQAFPKEAKRYFDKKELRDNQ